MWLHCCRYVEIDKEIDAATFRWAWHGMHSCCIQMPPRPPHTHTDTHTHACTRAPPHALRPPRPLPPTSPHTCLPSPHPPLCPAACRSGNCFLRLGPKASDGLTLSKLKAAPFRKITGLAPSAGGAKPGAPENMNPKGLHDAHAPGQASISWAIMVLHVAQPSCPFPIMDHHGSPGTPLSMSHGS